MRHPNTKRLNPEPQTLNTETGTPHTEDHAMASLQTARTRRRRRSNRQGAIAVLAALLMVAVMGMLAFAIDMGCVVAARTDIQRASDSGALAGAGRLGEGTSVAQQTAVQFVQANPVARDVVAAGDIQVEFGQWDEQTRTMLPGGQVPSAIRVIARQPDRPLFFGRLFGLGRFETQAEAVATYRPRDIVVVLDYSASMNDDSELRHRSKLGRAAVEANLLQIYNELGSPVFGSMQWTPTYIASNNVATVKRNLGLANVPYPYPRGSWDEYINYVRSDGDISAAGYRNRYGYLTLVNYWLERRPGFDETPDLWQTSQQPITAVKDAMSVFLSYLQIVDTDDRVGLSVYTAADGTGLLESPLTDDMASVETISRRRQAGHYHRYTNIAAGMEKAREELETNGRGGALRMIVLMTDGKANWTGSGYNLSAARQNVLDEASLCASLGFPIVTISLGSDADSGLMQQAADISGGVHFNVPGGGSVADYEEDLKDVFREIADDRPLRLVK